MAASLYDEAKSLLRFHRAILAAAAAATIVLGGSCYAVYRLQDLVQGMTDQHRIAADVYFGDDITSPRPAK
jgi:hypothetical protein